MPAARDLSQLIVPVTCPSVCYMLLCPCHTSLFHVPVCVLHVTLPLLLVPIAYPYVNVCVLYIFVPAKRPCFTSKIQIFSTLTDKEKSKTFLISSGCVTVPMVLISRTLSSCKSAFLNSFIMASSELASPFLRTVL